MFEPFVKLNVPDTSKLKFAELTLSDANVNRPTLTAEARLLAAEISGICSSGNKALAALVDHFGLKRSQARTFVIERTLKDVFERAFQEIGDEKTLNEKLRKFVAATDKEYLGFAGNEIFDPWRGPQPPPPDVTDPNISPKPRKPSGGGGMSWAKKESGLRSSGFRFFEPNSNDLQPPTA